MWPKATKSSLFCERDRAAPQTPLPLTPSSVREHSRSLPGLAQLPYSHHRGCSAPPGGTVPRHKQNCTLLYKWLDSSSTGKHAIILPRLETRVKPLSHQDHVRDTSSNMCNCFKSYMIPEHTWRYMFYMCIDFCSYRCVKSKIYSWERGLRNKQFSFVCFSICFVPVLGTSPRASWLLN